MSSYMMTVFLGAKTSVRGSTAPMPVLRVEAAGYHGPADVSFQMYNGLTTEERVKVAEEFAKNVVQWRDEIVADADRQRTAADELAAAREEITRLKAEAEAAS